MVFYNAVLMLFKIMYVQLGVQQYAKYAYIPPNKFFSTLIIFPALVKRRDYCTCFSGGFHRERLLCNCTHPRMIATVAGCVHSTSCLGRMCISCNLSSTKRLAKTEG